MTYFNRKINLEGKEVRIPLKMITGFAEPLRMLRFYKSPDGRCFIRINREIREDEWVESWHEFKNREDLFRLAGVNHWCLDALAQTLLGDK